MTNRWKIDIAPALSFVPELLEPPNGCCETGIARHREKSMSAGWPALEVTADGNSPTAPVHFVSTVESPWEISYDCRGILGDLGRPGGLDDHIYALM